VGNDPCTCPPSPEDDVPTRGRRTEEHGKHCTWPGCKGECLVTVTVEWQALASFLEAAKWGRADKPGTAGEVTGLAELERIIELGRNRST
jgi:hypothetical protein